MKHLTLGILAHVDAGKTTLSEAMLYRAGAIRSLGRVDHGSTFLDTDAQERARGITIFSKQAVFALGDTQVTLLDTPGHVDFSAEAERTIQVLDCAVLVIDRRDGVQGHTRTLWSLLRRFRVPTFLFINKMDLDGAGKDELLAQLREKLGGGFVDFTDEKTLREEAALCDEGAMQSYLDCGELSDEAISMLIAGRKVFPCCFGAALKTDGVEAFLATLERFAPIPVYGEEFGARVFKITHDAQGARLTHAKITGGCLKVKTPLTGGAGEDAWSEKADQLRLYSGEKFTLTDEAEAGSVVAIAGLTHTFAGQGLGAEEGGAEPLLSPVMTYRVELLDGTDPHTAMKNLRRLEEEDPELHVSAVSGELRLQLMGEVQMEVLAARIREQFGMEVRFSEGAICYRETVAEAVEGLGHFEPLRHYAEVFLRIEPNDRGKGISLDSDCPTDRLDRNWQRLIFTHLLEKEHAGVLTGSPLTDVKITLLAGRAHEKHTEGGDFRQATYRAVRHALMRAKSVLLEPWYDFRLEVPSAQVGRAMADLQRMNGEVRPIETRGDEGVLTGCAPASELQGYDSEVRVYTRGLGKLSLTPCGYRECPRAAEVIAAIGYDPERDTDNPADSVFCSHGAGVIVPWREVMERANAERERGGEETEEEPPRRTRGDYRSASAQDKELQAIFERTYGAIRPRQFQPPRPPKRAESAAGEKREIREQSLEEEYLLVDGYNVIFAWDDLKRAAAENLDDARKKLCEMLCNYQGYRNCRVIAVFDAYKVKGGVEHVEKYHNITVVYTKEAETADAYIERATYQLGKRHRVRVATSDAPEQIIILGHGALRLSARAFREEMEQALASIGKTLEKTNLTASSSGTMRRALELAQSGSE